jgi:alpha-D-ribose 1-methylphosphonate 5-triphosphate synthase subunit PhnH
VHDDVVGDVRGKAGVPRPRTASTAELLAIMRKTTSARSNTSAGLPATSAPAARSGALRSGLRFHTTSGVREAPDAARFSAMG